MTAIYIFAAIWPVAFLIVGVLDQLGHKDGPR